MSKALCIFGSSRQDGFTQRAINEVFKGKDYKLITLSEENISYYEYNSTTGNDSFITIAEAMNNAENIVFASPVYWYSMSGRMKVFIDRFSELVTSRKDLGRGLKGKRVFVIATGAELAPDPCFEHPFRATSEYFGMSYRGMFYWCSNALEKQENLEKMAPEFAERIYNNAD
jgi:multimeric flavodoxin WrbA